MNGYKESKNELKEMDGINHKSQLDTGEACGWY